MRHSFFTRTVLWVILLFITACSSDGIGTREDVRATPVSSPERVFNAVVGVYASVPDKAHTAQTLGTRRQGSGIIIDSEGLILTIGYLIVEADKITVLGSDGNPVPADYVAYDHETGFGLVRARKLVKPVSVRFGDSKHLNVGNRVLAISYEGHQPVVATKVVSRRSFAGSWEYLLDNAIFTSPAIDEFGGAALLGADGRLLGIGSLFVNDAAPSGRPVYGNMFVPIDALKPILADLITSGRRRSPAQPWLGIYPETAQGRVYISRLAAGGPGETAGLEPGDVIMGVAGKRVRDMEDFFRKVRNQGEAGVEVPLDILKMDSVDLNIRAVKVRSQDRHDRLFSR